MVAVDISGIAAAQQPARPGVLAPLRSRAFATLFAGYAFSAVGDGMAVVAVSWLAISLSRGRDTGLLVGAAVAAYTIPGVLAWLVLGRAVSGWDGRKLVLADALLRAAGLGLIAGLALAGLLPEAGYVVLLGVSSLFGLLGVSGDLASVAELLPATQHLAGNSLVTVASFGAAIVGPALAGGVIAIAGPGTALAADAASFALLALAVLASRRFQPPPSRPASQQSTRAALRALRRQPAVLGITVLCVVFFGVYGPVEVALPVYVSSVLHAGAGVLGGLWTVFSIGATAGALGASWVERAGIWRVVVLVVAGWGACLIPFGFTDSLVAGFAALAAGGLVYGPFLPLKGTIIQRESPPGSVAAIAAASAVFTVSASPLGTALGGPLVSAIGPSATLLASGLVTVTAAAVATLVLAARRHRRRRTPGTEIPRARP